MNIRELKSRLSHYLRLTKAGEAVLVTERGIPVGRIIPAGASLEERIQAMAESGLVHWNKQKLQRLMPVAKIKGKRRVADMLIEDR